MRALRHHTDGLKLDEVPVPSPGPNEVLVKVHATAITANELNWPETIERSNPIPGHDVAGIIAEVGDQVSGYTTGDEVFALTSFSRDGAAAEYVIATSNELAIKPPSLSFEHATAIPLAALTAWQAVYQHAHAKSGQELLITGAGGGVGVMIVQIARLAGLKITASCSSDKIELVKSLGAGSAIDYKKLKITDLSRDYDIVIECAGSDTIRDSFHILKGNGTMICLTRPPTDDEKAQRPDVHGTFFIVEPDGEELTQIAQLCEQNLIRPIVQSVLPLDKGAEAFELLNGGHSKGKIVLKVQ